MPVDPELRRKYQAVLKNENVNWSKQVICSAHWSKGERLSLDDIPDVICSKQQQEKLESLMEKTPSKSLKKKVACARRVLVEANHDKRGYAGCGILGDNTETWIAQSDNFELNNLTFSHYKNHTTGKVSVWIFPHSALCKCSDAFPGSISDEQLTEQIGVIDYCPKGKVVMTDKGFAISDLCHEMGVHHSRPPLKNNYQYDENDINLNFDIATLRIYNENAIGRIRDWSILNKCWPLGRVDLLGICWIALAHC
ncbi:hypothetical protein ACROYT_G032479 [Oculina patagonica]